MRYLIIILLIILSPVNVYAEIAVIANLESNIVKLTQRQITDIYMGRQQYLKNGQKLIPLDQSENSAIRAEFYHLLTGKPISMINAYWARLLFTGRALPPMLVEDNQAMLEAVKNNANAIGYLESDFLNEHVKIIYQLDENE